MSQQYQLSFRSRVRYEEHETGIPMRVALHAGDEDFECLACYDEMIYISDYNDHA